MLLCGQNQGNLRLASLGLDFVPRYAYALSPREEKVIVG